MTVEEIDLMIQEATKNYIDHSLSSVHSKLQDALTSEHRSSYESGSWHDYPQVHHVFGDKDSGQVVYRQGDTHFRAPYKMDNGGAGYTIGSSQPVQMAYVPSSVSVQEALVNHPDAAIEVMERYISTTERKTIPSEDFAGKDKSFPIKTASDVRAALDSIGRAGSGNHSPEELKSRILAIAKRKGFAVPKSDQDAKESATLAAKEVEETIILQEAKSDAKGNALIKLISPGAGSMGYYSADVLKEAAKNKVFPKSTRMFLDHQSAAERAARPEGDVKKWAATTSDDAVYLEGASAPDGDGLYANTNIYPDHKPFIEARRKDIGVSVRAGVVTTGAMKEGVPEVKEMKYALSADFVTRAGRGGKLVEMYESFRSSTGQETEGIMNDEEKRQLTVLQESVAALNLTVPKQAARIDRLQEENDRLRADRMIAESLVGSGLTARAGARVSKMLVGVLPMKDGVLDAVAFQESVKAAIVDEKAYLQESGVRVSPFQVRGMGGVANTTADATGTDDALLQEADKAFDGSIDSIMGREKKGTAA